MRVRGLYPWALLGLVLGCLWCAVAQAGTAPEPPRELFMQVGDQVTLPAQGVKSYSEGIAGVVEVRVPRDGSEFVLVALRPGSTTLLFFLFDGREREVKVHVHAPPEAREDPLAVAPADNVRLDLYFVQVSESTGHDLGIAYPDSIGGTARLTASFDVAQAALSEASIGIADQILPRLDLAQRTGRARIASKASVVSVNGKQALYNSGGEVNVRVQGALTAEVRPIRYGSQLQMAPRFDPEARRVELTISAEIAALSDDGGTGVPGRQVSTLNTVVNLDLGKSLVLAGLSSESDAHSARGLPWLSRIPVLGALFGSQGFRSERVRNYLVIVPCVVQAVASEERRVVDELLHAYQEFDGDVRALKLDPASLGETGARRGGAR